MKLTKKYLNDLTYKIIGAAIEVHKELGPGLLESVYHKCLIEEFKIIGFQYSSEQIVDISYKNVEVNTQLRCDFLVENCIVVELKSVDKLLPIFDAQILTYMKLLEKSKGILINFNVSNIFKEGQKTMVNDLFRNLPNE